jgi:hypothetical protein
MKYAVVMDSGAMIYIPNFIKIGHSVAGSIRSIEKSKDSSGIA